MAMGDAAMFDVFTVVDLSGAEKVLRQTTFAFCLTPYFSSVNTA